MIQASNSVVRWREIPRIATTPLQIDRRSLPKHCIRPDCIPVFSLRNASNTGSSRRSRSTVRRSVYSNISNATLPCWVNGLQNGDPALLLGETYI